MHMYMYCACYMHSVVVSAGVYNIIVQRLATFIKEVCQRLCSKLFNTKSAVPLSYRCALG